MHQYEQSFFREHRLSYLNGAEMPSAGMEAAALKGQTHTLLDGLRQTITLPSETVGVAAEKVALTGLAAMNIALLGGVFAAGFSMILTGQPPSFLRKLSGKES